MAKSKAKPGQVSVADFAEQLKVHKNAVYNWRKKGWITWIDGEGIDADKALVDLRNSPCPVVTDEPEETEADVEARAEADRRRAVAQADREEMRSAQERGDLVRRDAVQTMLFAASRAIRDRLAAIPVRVAPRVAASSDVAVCARLVAGEIDQALEELVPESLRAG